MSLSGTAPFHYIDQLMRAQGRRDMVDTEFERFT
jgi:hypothetical protein